MVCLSQQPSFRGRPPRVVLALLLFLVTQLLWSSSLMTQAFVGHSVAPSQLHGATCLHVLKPGEVLETWTKTVDPESNKEAFEKMLENEAVTEDYDAIEIEYQKMTPSFHAPKRTQSYTDFVYTPRQPLHVRIKLSRKGHKHNPFFWIVAQKQRAVKPGSSKYFERLGFWDPLKDATTKDYFKLKCDRVLYWLRRGAQPTDQVASLLDMAGLIRRTGRWAQNGQWELRVPKDTVSSPPPGWEYNGQGPHLVTWNNRPMLTPFVKKPRAPRDRPLVEKFGFKRYKRIPIDGDVLYEPVDGTAVFQGKPLSGESQYVD